MHMNVANAIDSNQSTTALPATQISGSLARGRERFMQMTDRVWDRSKGLAREMDYCVHEHTWMAVGITAAVGIILGLAVSRR